MDKNLKDYLNDIPIKQWNETHLKIYRDTVSHRIPLYVPPEMVNPHSGTTLDGPAPFYIHSLIEAEFKYAPLHFQIIFDFNTALEIGEHFCDMFPVRFAR